MSKDKKPYQLTEVDIQEYLKGNINGKKAHQIERFLLDHSFEKEATEGLAGLTDDTLAADLKLLRGRIGQEKNSAFGLQKIAAAVALLMVSFAAVWFYLENTDASSTIALNDPTPPEKPVGPDDRQATQPPSIPEEQVNDEAIGEVFSENLASESEAKAVDLSGESGGQEPQETPAAVSTEYIADIQEEQKVSAKEQIQLMDEDLEEVVVMNEVITEEPVEAEPQQVRIHGMAAARAISNDKVTKTSRRKTKAAELNATEDAMVEPEEEVNRDAVPFGSFEAFYQYVEEHIVYPDSAKQAGNTGDVLLDVVISPAGQVIGIHIVSGPGYACNEEAIRLVKEVPEWTPAIQNGRSIEDTVQVIIHFE